MVLSSVWKCFMSILFCVEHEIIGRSFEGICNVFLFFVWVLMAAGSVCSWMESDDYSL